VISVGNLTVGGTGKTPMVLYIAKRLLGEGKRVGILTRGYRGFGSTVKHSAAEGSEATSDEVQLLMAHLRPQVAFGVGANRLEKGLELAKQGVDWFVLDDGFQHLRLARDVDIVLIDATNPFGGGHLLPAGRLREPRTALARADILVITRSDHAPAIEAAVQRDSDAPIFYAQTKLDGLRSFFAGQWGGDLRPGDQRKLFAFCAIGNPSAFLSDLRRWGFDVVSDRFFPDHHRYSLADEEAITKQAQAAGATGLVCTEKDLYNLHQLPYGNLHLFCCVISLQITDEDDFWRTLAAVAASRVPANRRKVPLVG
jgi:tetraacyldisaccharide 4'-kinase